MPNGLLILRNKKNRNITQRTPPVSLNDSNDYENNDNCVTVCDTAILVPLYWSSAD
jgi:hypothetical protein